MHRQKEDNENFHPTFGAFKPFFLISSRCYIPGFFEPQISLYVMKNTKTLVLLPEFGLLFHTILFSSLPFLISNDQYSISGRLYLIHGETVMEVKGAH